VIADPRRTAQPTLATGDRLIARPVLTVLAPPGVARKRKAAFALPDFITGDALFEETAKRAKDALLEARGTIKTTRSANDSLAQAGARALFATMSGPEMSAALHGAVLAVTAGAPKNVGRLNAFVKFMQAKFPFIPPLPVVLEGVMVYCANHVVVLGHMSKYLSDVVSELRVATRPRGQWGLSEDDEAHLLAVNQFLQRSFPSASAPQPTLSLEQLERLYRHLAALDCVEARLCAALVKMMVGMQARASELLDGALWAGDIVFHAYGVLINSVLNKCRKNTLDPVARVAPRLPEHLAVHDPMEALHAHLFRDAGWAAGAQPHNRPVFQRPILGADGKWALSGEALSRDAGRDIILKHLRLAGVAHDPAVFSFTLHFGRAAGFNLLHNTLMVDRELCAAAGGWRHGDVLDKHYQVRSPLELAVSIRAQFIHKAELLRWKLV
jgi:hypothetical protein